MLCVFPSFPKLVPKPLDPTLGMCPGQSLGSDSSLAWLPDLSQSAQVSPAGEELLLQVPVVGS